MPKAILRGLARRCLDHAPLALVLALLAWTLPSIIAHLRHWMQPEVFTEDARQHIFPYLRYYVDGAFRNDTIADYFMACHPVAYRALFMAWSHVADPRLLGKLLPYATFVVLIAAVWAASARLGGMFTGAFSAGFVMFSSNFIGRAMGGFPRAFGYPMLALMLWALVAGRVRLLIALAVAATAFYPIVAVPVGLALALWLVCYPARLRGEAEHWRLPVRLAVVAGAAALVFLAELPSERAMRAFGKEIKPTEWTKYPEAGPAGRSLVTMHDTLSTDGSSDIMSMVRRTLVKGGAAFWPAMRNQLSYRLNRPWPCAAILLLAIGGLALRARRNAAAARLLAIVPAAVAAYLAARAVYPLLHQPGRYAVYAIPTFLVIALPAAVLGWAELFAGWRDAPAGAAARPAAKVAALLVCTPLLLGAGGIFYHHTSRRALLTEADMDLMRFVQSLPPDSLLAGWDKVDCIPYAGERPILLSAETHLCYHKAYVKEMRRRFDAQLAAYVATNLPPLLDLRDTYGVSHLVVCPRHFAGEVPRYFAPFGRRLRRAVQQVGAVDDLETFRQRAHAQVYESEKLFVLDLARLRDEP